MVFLIEFDKTSKILKDIANTDCILMGWEFECVFPKRKFFKDEAVLLISNNDVLYEMNSRDFSILKTFMQTVYGKTLKEKLKRF